MTLGILILPNMAQPQKHPVPYLEEIRCDQVFGKVFKRLTNTLWIVFVAQALIVTPLVSAE